MNGNPFSLHVITFPPRDQDLSVLELARDLHRRELDEDAREFPLDDSWLPYVVIVIVSADRAVAYASFENQQPDYDLWWVKWILVDSSSRSLGFGTRLLAEIGRQARDAGVSRVCLEPEPGGDASVEAWYLRVGFEWVEEENTAPSRFLSISPSALKSD